MQPRTITINIIDYGHHYARTVNAISGERNSIYHLPVPGTYRLYIYELPSYQVFGITVVYVYEYMKAHCFWSAPVPVGCGR